MLAARWILTMLHDLTWRSMGLNNYLFLGLEPYIFIIPLNGLVGATPVIIRVITAVKSSY